MANRLPLERNDIFEMDITGMTHDGLGVGRKDGIAVFVQGALDGEKALVKVIKVTGSYAIARIEELLTESPDRIKAACPVYKRCGGCSLQHMTYDKTLRFKKQVVVDAIARLGGFEGKVVHDVLGMENPTRYRNKAQYPVGVEGDHPVIGFFARRSHEIVDAEQCLIQHESSEKAREAVLNWIWDNNVSVYDEATQKGLVRHVVTKVGMRTGEIMVILVVTDEKIPKPQLLVKSLQGISDKLVNVILNIHTEPGNVVLGKKNIALFGEPVIFDKLCGLEFEITPLSFYQVNPDQCEVLYGKAIELAELTGKETVYDLYCGIGTIGMVAASSARRVIGVEVEPEAVKSAERNAFRNGLANMEFFLGEAETVVPKLVLKGKTPDVVFIDPPRKGCEESLLNTLIELQPEKIVYVSCNPATLARDLKILCASGYVFTDVQPVDMFPWTEHVETVVLMSRVDK